MNKEINNVNFEEKQMPPRHQTAKSKLKEPYSEDEFVMIEEDEEPVIASTKYL